MKQEKNKILVSDMTIIAICTALLCVIAPFSVPLPMMPVPLSLATAAIYLFSYILDMKKAVATCALYIMIGVVGLPVFSGFKGGIAVILGPTGGYIIGYIFLTLIISFIIKNSKDNMVMYVLGMLVGTIVLYTFGTVWIIVSTHMQVSKAVMVCVVPFIVGDVLKMVSCVLVAKNIKNRI